MTAPAATPKLATPPASKFSFASLFAVFEEIPAEVQAILPSIQEAEAIFAKFLTASAPTAGSAVVVEPKT